MRIKPCLLLLGILACLAPAVAQIASPSLTEINLDGLPFGQYYSNANPGPMPACPYNTNATVQSCVRAALASYAAAGVTGVRVMFPFCPNPANPNDVQALTSCNPAQASVNQTWAANVDAFMSDVAAAGIQRISLSPIFWGWTMFSNPPSQTFSPDPCFQGTVTLYWEASAPFGQIITGYDQYNQPQYAPWPQNFNDAYSCSPQNPYFVGWQNLYNAINTVIQKAYNHGLTVAELDVSQELDLLDFTVQARFITDNKHTSTGNPDLVWSLGYYMAYWGYDSQRVTYSGTETRTASAGNDCGSVYGDSARIVAISEIYAGIGAGSIGQPGGIRPDLNYGLACSGSADVMFNGLPNDHSLPDILDLHSYPCVSVAWNNIACQSGQSHAAIQGEASKTYSDTMAFITSFGPSGWRGYNASVWNSPFLLGETHSNNYTSEPSSGTTCEGAPAYAPWDTVAGFNQSTLAGRYVNGSPGTIFRPWNYPEGACNLMPNPMGPYLPQ